MERRWAVAVTSVEERLASLLPATLESLEAGGFPRPHLFLDGVKQPPDHLMKYQTTCRWPKVNCAGNWTLSLQELFIRRPEAERYAIFQDDLLICKNVKQYLDRIKYNDGPACTEGRRPTPCYWNLYHTPAERDSHLRGKAPGFHQSLQNGRGALALIFSREAVITLLCSRAHIVERPVSDQGYRRIDGGIVCAMKKAGWEEWVHLPNLVVHTGRMSTVDKRERSLGKDSKFPRYAWDHHYDRTDFPGEEYDALDLLKGREVFATNEGGERA